MNVLMLGTGQGSFEVRGRQLGYALDARVLKDGPSSSDLAWADVVVLIKRAHPAWADLVHRARKPLVWDALDFWAQPDQNHLPEADARAVLHGQIDRFRPTLVIGATEAMAEAAGGAYLSHHVRPGLKAVPIRDQVWTVAYEGTKKYLGRWADVIEAACHARGWRFVINPLDLQQADLIVAFRDGQWDGWMCREWKSGVKLVNAIAAGRPIITQPSAAMREIHPAGSVIERFDQLDAALDLWMDRDLRAAVAKEAQGRWHTLSLAMVAANYQRILRDVVKRTETEAVA